MRVIQASENISKGDAISHYMFLIADILQEMGVENAFLSIHCDEKVEREVLRPATYESREDDVIIFHASIGGEMFDYLKSLPAKKILMYHNMTPSGFFKGFDDHLALMLEKGKEQLIAMRESLDAVYGVSEYNVLCLQELGFKNVQKFPFSLAFEEFDNAKNHRTVEIMKKNAPFSLVFYGRMAPHKCQHDLIKLLAFYRKFYNANAQLYLMGSYNQEERYYLTLEALIQELHLSGNVHIQGHVPYPELVSRIHASDVFVCMSEHEGLLVPLLECFHAGVPVIAYGAGAIPETMSGRGICLDAKSFSRFAEELYKIETDRAFRESVVLGQQERAGDFTPNILREHLTTLLSSL